MPVGANQPAFWATAFLQCALARKKEGLRHPEITVETCARRTTTLLGANRPGAKDTGIVQVLAVTNSPCAPATAASYKRTWDYSSTPPR